MEKNLRGQGKFLVDLTWNDPITTVFIVHAYMCTSYQAKKLNDLQQVIVVFNRSKQFVFTMLLFPISSTNHLKQLTVLQDLYVKVFNVLYRLPYKLTPFMSHYPTHGMIKQLTEYASRFVCKGI